MADPAIQRNFAAGELAPVLHARADTVKYATGLRTCRNFMVRKEGGVSNRPGLPFVGKAKSGASGLIKLYRWVFTAADDSFLIEAGDEYFRFYQNGARVELVIADLPAWGDSIVYVVGDLVQHDDIAYYCILGHTNQEPPDTTYWYPLDADAADATLAIYEIPTPYTAGSFDSPGPLRFAQSGAVITITHPGYAPAELQNLTAGGDPRWVLVSPVLTDPEIDPPDHFNWTPGIPGPSGGHTLAYVVTAATEETYEESLPTEPVSIADVGMPTELTPDVLTWDAVAGAAEYYVYMDPYGNGTFGFIGVATGQTTFNNPGLAPDFENTPPIPRSALFTGTNNFPEMSTFYQQRRLYGYTHNKPSTVWASRTGFRNNFTIRSPIQDDDAVTFTPATNDLAVLRHLVQLKRLVILMDTGEWVVRGDSDGVLTPTAISLDQEGYAGASRAFPAIVGNRVLFVQARGSVVRDLTFSSDIALVDTRDLTIYASHLVNGFTITRLDFQQVPHSVVWAVRSDGVLLGLTYLPEQDIWGWHRHDTANGLVEDICVVPEGDADVLYVVVKRTILGETVRYIERLADREIDAADVAHTAQFLDSMLTYDDAATTDIDGLDHLEGESVMALADGLVQGPFTVSGGAITLDTAASLVHVGLAVTAELETLDLDVQGSTVRDKRKRVQGVSLLIERSAYGFEGGPDREHLTPQRPDFWKPTTGVVSERIEMNITTRWREDGRVVIRQTSPLPLTVLAVMPYVEVGG